MRGIVRLACLMLAGLLAGCALLNQPFSCESGQAYWTGETDTHPAIVSPQGYRHC